MNRNGSVFTWRHYVFGRNAIAGLIQSGFYLLVFILVFGTAFWLALR